MNRQWNVIAGLVLLYTALCGAGWLLDKIDFDTFIKALAPVVGPAIGYFAAFMPRPNDFK